jgi:hypothetical protein
VTTDADRLAALERAVAELQRDVGALRAALGAARGAPDAAAAPRDLSLGAAGPRAPARASDGPAAGGRPPGWAPPGWTHPAWASARGPDLEALVGRYATVAVAALVILMGVGAFLTWAAARFTLTPAARVGLGLAAALALAALGLWLRVRGALPGVPTRATAGADDADARAGARRFGGVLLALALAVVHVDAWAAGPFLQLVPPAGALAAAAAASAALAALAWRAREEWLFAVGLGGTILAPFVAGAGSGRPFVLAAYGALVLSAGFLGVPAPHALVAPRGRAPTAGPDGRLWVSAFVLLAAGGFVYTMALLGDAAAVTAVGNPAGLRLPAWALRRDVPVLLPLACALLPLGVGAARARRLAAGAGESPRDRLGAHAALALAYAACALAALWGLVPQPQGGAPTLVWLALAATLVTYGALALARLPNTPAAAAALALPLALLLAALVALPVTTGPAGALVAALWAALAAGAALRDRGRAAPAGGAFTTDARTAAHVAAAGLASALVPVLPLAGYDVPRVALLAGHAALTVQVLRRVRHPLVLLAPLAVLAVATGWAAVLLEGRRAYAYTPFLTPASVAAAAVVAAWAAVAWRVWHDGQPAVRPAERRPVVWAAAGAALVWGRSELARAVSPDVSTFLLIGYFAVAGTAAIALGRARRVAAARQAGLALALYAALKAVAQASALESVALRVGSYLLVGGFLLGVGYWYRAAGAARADDAPADARPGPTPAGA